MFLKRAFNGLYFQIDRLLSIFHLEHYLLYVSEVVLGGLRRDEAHRQRALNLYGQFIRPGDLCFDIGANLGNRVALFLALGATVVAVEPQEICTRVLQLKFGRYVRQKRLHILNHGVGARGGGSRVDVSCKFPFISRLYLCTGDGHDRELSGCGVEKDNGIPYNAGSAD